MSRITSRSALNNLNLLAKLLVAVADIPSLLILLLISCQCISDPIIGYWSPGLLICCISWPLQVVFVIEVNKLVLWGFTAGWSPSYSVFFLQTGPLMIIINHLTCDFCNIPDVVQTHEQRVCVRLIITGCVWGNASVSVAVSESGHINMSGLTCYQAQLVKIDMIPLSLLSSSQMTSKSSNVTRSQLLNEKWTCHPFTCFTSI